MLEIRTSHVIHNEEWRPVLIYLSEEPLTFDNMITHVVTEGSGAIKRITVYTCENWIFAEYEPDDEDPRYAYWFLIESFENQEVADLKTFNKVSAELAEYKQAYSILTGIDEKQEVTE